MHEVTARDAKGRSLLRYPLWLKLWLALFVLGGCRAARSDVPQPGPGAKAVSSGAAAEPWGAATLRARMAKAMARLSQATVVYRDVLGEGPGGWDSDPRYPNGEVNCVIWLRQVIAESYGRTPEQKQRVMDQLRYYQGQVGFSLRKHFGARWMGLDPAPLQPMDVSSCTPDAHFDVTLDLEHFRRSHRYGCPLYRNDARRFRITYTPSSTIVDCAKAWAPGFYILFGVPSQGYIDKYGKKSGPMGLVHGMILEVVAPDTEVHVSVATARGESTNTAPVPPSVTSSARAGGRSRLRLHHGTVALKKVIVEDLKSFVDRMHPRLHAGYVVYTLDPNFTPSQPPQATEAIKRLQACEANLPGGGRSRGMHGTDDGD